MNSNKRTSKVKNGILLAIVIAFLIAIIGGTYARFVSTGSVTSSTDIAKWHVVLSGNNPEGNLINQDISTEHKTLTVPVIDAETNTNVVEGKLAPGKTVVAIFNIDPTGSEVSMDYTVNINLNGVEEFDHLGELSNSNQKISDLGLKLFKVTYITEGTSEEVDMLIDTTTGSFVFEQPLADVLAGKDVTFKAYLRWSPTTDLTRSLADTEKVVNIDNIRIPVSIEASQHIGGSNPNLTNPTLLTAKYTDKQIMDCQRSPGNPSTGDETTISGFKKAFKYDREYFGVPEGHYLKAVSLGKASDLDDNDSMKMSLIWSYGENAATMRLDEYNEYDELVGKYTDTGVLREFGEGSGIYLFLSSYGYVLCTTEEAANTLWENNTATAVVSEILSTLE